MGASGDDYLSGDLGNDSLSGGDGADQFFMFMGAGIDRVLDFDLGEGDRVVLGAGAEYTVAQVGDDTVITLTGGGQMVLQGVELASLDDGWIVSG